MGREHSPVALGRQFALASGARGDCYRRTRNDGSPSDLALPRGAGSAAHGRAAPDWRSHNDCAQAPGRAPAVPGETLAQWWARRPRFVRRAIVMTAAGASISIAAGSMRGRVTPSPQATLEQRVAMLENSYTNLFDEVSSLGNEAKRRSDDLAGKLQAETTARSGADKKIEEQLKETAVGSFHLDLLGVASSYWGSLPGQLHQRSPRCSGRPDADEPWAKMVRGSRDHGIGEARV